MARVERDKGDDSWMAKVRCKPALVVLFTRQLATMLRTGVPILHALDTLSHQSENPNFGEVVSTVAERIGHGHTFSSTLSRFPRVFNRVYVTMAAIGERTGQLDESLERLANWQERDFKLFQRVRSALTYPAFVLGLSAFLTLMLFYSVLPGFITVFNDMDMELPLMTRMMVTITNAVKNPGAWLVVMAAVGLGFGAVRDIYKTEKGAMELFRVVLAVPVIGSLLHFATTARYCAAVGALLSAGLDLPKSLNLGAQASGSPVLAWDAKALINNILEGESVASYMVSRPDIYPSTLCQMVAAGEESSHLAPMYERVASFYDQEVNFKIEAFSAALEPLLLGMVASVVGFVVLSIFIPMYSYIGKLGA